MKIQISKEIFVMKQVLNNLWYYQTWKACLQQAGINAVLIHQGLQQSERLMQLNKIAITQMKSLLNSRQIAKLKK